MSFTRYLVGQEWEEKRVQQRSRHLKTAWKICSMHLVNFVRIHSSHYETKPWGLWGPKNAASEESYWRALLQWSVTQPSANPSTHLKGAWRQGSAPHHRRSATGPSRWSWPLFEQDIFPQRPLEGQTPPIKLQKKTLLNGSKLWGVDLLQKPRAKWQLAWLLRASDKSWQKRRAKPITSNHPQFLCYLQARLHPKLQHQTSNLDPPCLPPTKTHEFLLSKQQQQRKNHRLRPPAILKNQRTPQGTA